MKFSGHKSLEDFLKKANVTVLLEKIYFSRSSGFSVVPVQCPAVTDKKEGLIYNEENKAVCVRGANEECPYFNSAVFDIHGYIKEIDCKAR